MTGWDPAAETVGYFQENPLDCFWSVEASVGNTNILREDRGMPPVIEVVLPDWMATLPGFEEWRQALDYTVITRNEDRENWVPSD